MLIKTLTIIVFISIITSLGVALYNLVRPKSDTNSHKTVQALTVRIAVSIGLFFLLAIALFTGVLKPNGIGARIEQIQANKQILPTP